MVGVPDISLSDLFLDFPATPDRSWRQVFADHRLTVIHLMRAVT
jgi:hypothetical protein